MNNRDTIDIVSGFANVNGTCLYYEQAGEGEALILLHGFTLNSRMWDDQFEVFAQQYQVIRFDLRGYGQSAMPTKTPYVAANDVKALLDYLNIEQAHILGLSMGGGYALEFALVYPTMTKSLILTSSTLGGYKWQHFGGQMKIIGAVFKNSGILAALRQWFEHDIFASARANATIRNRLREMIFEYSGWVWFNKDPIQVPNLPAIECLHEVTPPTLVISGQSDILDFQRIADILEKNIPHVHKVVMPGVGHMVNMEAPAQFNKMVLSFLTGKLDD